MSYGRNARKVHQIATRYDAVCVIVHRSPALQEYRVRLYIKGSAQPNADAFTDDLQDARDTALAMFRHTTANLKG